MKTTTAASKIAAVCIMAATAAIAHVGSAQARQTARAAVSVSTPARVAVSANAARNVSDDSGTAGRTGMGADPRRPEGPGMIH
jgi:hypothetical protein